MLRFLDEGQYEAVKATALARGQSVNEWLVRLVEREVDGGPRKVSGVVGKTGVQGVRGRIPDKRKGARAAAVLRSSDKTPADGNAVAKGGGQDRSAETEEIDLETAVCMRCDGIVLRDPKNPKYWRCADCKMQLADSEVK